jgi:hypothetical protein
VGDRVAEQRVVKVKLSARVEEYVAALEKAAQKTRETGTEAQKASQKIADM